MYGAVAFDDHEQASAAKSVLMREGSAVELQHQADGSVVVVATPSGSAPTLAALVQRMQLLAGEFGGEFLGHGGTEQYPLKGRS